MKFTHHLLALALACSTGHAVAATPSYLGDLLAYQDMVVVNTIYGEIGTPINDVYSFDIGSFNAETVATAVKVSLQFGTAAVPIFDIDNFAISLRDTNGFLYAFDDSFNANGELEFGATLAPSSVGLPGFYEFVVTGITAGTSGGTYLGAMSARTVPEPNRWLLMLAGVGLIGLFVERAKHRPF